MPDAAGVGGWGGGEVPQGQGGQGAGLCMGHGCLLSSGGDPVWPVAAGTGGSSLPGHLLFAGKQVSRGRRPARPGRREALDSSGRPAFRFEHGASARSTTPFCASRILGAQIWNPREEGVRPAPRALSLSWCRWQTPCLRLALPPRLSPEQDDCGHLRPGEGAKSRCRPRPSRGREAPAGGPALVPALRLPQLQPGRERRSFQGL